LFLLRELEEEEEDVFFIIPPTRFRNDDKKDDIVDEAASVMGRRFRAHSILIRRGEMLAQARSRTIGRATNRYLPHLDPISADEMAQRNSESI